MPKQYPPKKIKNCAVPYALERLDRYKSVYAVHTLLVPKLNFSKETLRRWLLSAKVDAGDRTRTNRL